MFQSVHILYFTKIYPSVGISNWLFILVFYTPAINVGVQISFIYHTLPWNIHSLSMPGTCGSSISIPFDMFLNLIKFGVYSQSLFLFPISDYHSYYVLAQYFRHI